MAKNKVSIKKPTQVRNTKPFTGSIKRPEKEEPKNGIILDNYVLGDD